MIGKARAFRPDLHEGLVDQQQSAAAAQAIGESEQRILGNKPSIGIVRIDDDGDARVGQLTDLGNFDDIVARKLRHAAMLGISRRQYRGAAARQQEGRLRQQDLRARPGHHMRHRRRAVA